MKNESRLHRRARVKWPVVIFTPRGLVDGEIKNLSLGGAFIRFAEKLRSNYNLSMVITVNGRFIPCKGQIVWSNGGKSFNRRKSRGIGIRFTKMMLTDRKFLHSEISNNL